MNLSKTKCMLLHSPYIKAPNKTINIIGHSYECLHSKNFTCVGCENVEFVKEYRYLGLTVDCSFSWKSHINIVCSKLRSLLTQFKQLSYVVDRKTLRMLYHALPDAVLSYGLIAYGLTFPSYLDKISNLQIRFLKLLLDKKTRMQCKNNDKLYFTKCNILSVHNKVKYLLAIEQSQSSEFKTIKLYNTNLRKDMRKKYEEPRATNYYGKRTRRYLIPRLYNAIPVDESASKNVLKRKLKLHFLKQSR